MTIKINKDGQHNTAFQVYTPINAHTFLALQTVKAHGVIAIKSLALLQATSTHVQLCMTRAFW